MIISSPSSLVVVVEGVIRLVVSSMVSSTRVDLVLILVVENKLFGSTIEVLTLLLRSLSGETVMGDENITSPSMVPNVRSVFGVTSGGVSRMTIPSVSLGIWSLLGLRAEVETGGINGDVSPGIDVVVVEVVSQL